MRGFRIEALPAQQPAGTRAVVLEMRRLVLAHVNEQPLSLIRRSGLAAALGEEAIVPTVAGAFDAAPKPRA